MPPIRLADQSGDKPIDVEDGRAKPSDTVVWDAGNLNVTIAPAPDEEYPFTDDKIDINGGEGSATVREDAREEAYVYTIFCHNTGQFLNRRKVPATHPVMEIGP